MEENRGDGEIGRGRRRRTGRPGGGQGDGGDRRRTGRRGRQEDKGYMEENREMRTKGGAGRYRGRQREIKGDGERRGDGKKGRGQWSY